jgi:hypothetical protein
MADPNVALDPNAVPMRDLWGLDREGNQAAPPTQPPVVTPQAPAPPQQPAGPPAPPPATGGALQTNVPPPSKPPSEASKWGLDKFDDADDANERALAQRDASDAYRNKDGVLSHLNNFNPISQETKLEQHPLYERYNELVTKVWPTLTKQEQAARQPARRAMEMRINSDLKQQNAEVRKRHEELLRVGDEKFDNFDQREKSAATVGGYVDNKLKETEAWTKHGDPKIRNKYDYDLKTSPLSTMRRARPDGTFDNTPLRDAATAIATLNHVSVDQAVDYVLGIGSPVGYDDKTGLPYTGYNGRRGSGGASYKVIGRDVRDRVVIETSDHRRLRLPPEVLDQLVEAREKGYAASRKYQADRKAAEQPGLVGRTINDIRDRFK